MDPSLRAQLDAVLSSQRGLVTRRQCIQAGLAPGHIDAMLRRGALSVVSHGVYAIGGLPPDGLRHVMAAVLAAGPDAVVGRESAAALLGLGRVAELHPVHLLVPDTTPDALPGVVTHRTRRLEACDVTEVDGLPCTTAARTLVDLAAVTDKATLTALVDDAMGLGVAHRNWLHRRAVALRSGRRGVGILVALTADEAEGKFRSWLERRAAYELKAAGVPPPRWNEPIRCSGRLLGVADACWRPQRLIAEFDGLRFHSTPEQRRADAERERELVLAGWRVLRFSWLDVEQQPGRMCAALLRALTSGVSPIHT